MEPLDAASVEHRNTLNILYLTIGIIPQSFVYGIYCCLIPHFIFTTVQRGLQATTRRVMLFVTLYMFIISSIHWISSVVNLIQRFRGWIADADGPAAPPVTYRELLSAVVLTNYFLTDAVVVWRAWVLCNDENKASKVALRITAVLLSFLALSVATTIVIRILLTIPSRYSKSHNGTLNRAIDVSQTANLGISLLTNISVILIISAKAWKHRRSINQNLPKSTRNRRFFMGSRILLVLIESGVLYCFSGVITLAALFIRLEFGTLGDLYTLVNFQIAGIYPILVLLLVNKDRSMDKMIFTAGLS
ncbi:hypothetical protein GYMLUDRAFT_225216, partial [Collybiopsis luxurians FD-317 M1]